MNEADVRLSVSHALQWYGYWPKHNQDGRKYPHMCWKCGSWNSVLITADVKGLPDIETRHPEHPNSMIEVKIVDKNSKSFAFNQIEPEQRKYLDDFTLAKGAAYLAIGKIVPAKSKTKIHSIVVFPWAMWRLMETAAVYEKSMPYSWDLYEKRPKKWEDARDVLDYSEGRYALRKVGNDWIFSINHPLAFPQPVEVPFYKRVRKEYAENIS